jgi:two-component system, cell cycle sensor histidine kinase and response regulator CckA
MNPNTETEALAAQRTAELQAANDQLKKELAANQAQKMEAVSELASGLAHDLNNILAIVQGNASLLLAGRPPTDKEAKSLESICAAVDRASKLVRHLLTLSRKQLPEMRPINLRDVVKSVSQSLSDVLTPNINVELRMQDGLPNICADAEMLEVVLINLAVNARDAMPNGGRLIVGVDTVEMTAGAASENAERRAGKFVRLSVTDTGGGIPADVLPRIFEPFFTTKPVGKGTGLGLSTVYGIARQHLGWVEVQSKINEGSTFQVLIPEMAPVQSAPTLPEPKPAGASSGGETILVVEDEPDLRELVLQILDSSGYKVITAGSGAEALQAWATHRAEIRLLLTDLALPDGMSGQDLADRLTTENPQLRVILTSGYSAGLPGTELAGVDSRRFLAKPYRPSTLLEIVRRGLDEPLSEMAGAAA